MKFNLSAAFLSLLAIASVLPTHADVYEWKGSGNISTETQWTRITDGDLDYTGNWWYAVWSNSATNVMLFSNNSENAGTAINDFNDMSVASIVVTATAADVQYLSANGTGKEIYFTKTSTADISTISTSSSAAASSMLVDSANVIVASGKTFIMGQDPTNTSGTDGYDDAFLSANLNIVVGSGATFQLEATKYDTNNYTTTISGGGTFILASTSISDSGLFVIEGSTLQIDNLTGLTHSITVSGDSTISSIAELTLSGKIIIKESGTNLTFDGSGITFGDNFVLSIYEEALLGEGVSIAAVDSSLEDITIQILDSEGSVLNDSVYYTSFVQNSDGSYSFTVIPEPATASLSLIALAGLMIRRRRQA